MKQQVQKSAAILTVHRIPEMTKKGRRDVCSWLRRLADDIQNEPKTFAKTFRARYMYSGEQSPTPQESPE
jgi:hypothetical protein